MNAIAESLAKESFVNDARRDREARVQAGKQLAQDNGLTARHVERILARVE